MPPKTKITKEAIVDAAIELVRERGESALNARSIAKELGCSTQPVFSNFTSMQELKTAVISAAEAFFGEYLNREIEHSDYPPYKASGMAYIYFAKEEKELFRFLYMRDRKNEENPPSPDLTHRMETMIHDNTGLQEERVQLFHLEMWAFVHGIAMIMASGFLDLDRELVSMMLTDAYQGLIKHFNSEEVYGSNQD